MKKFIIILFMVASIPVLAIDSLGTTIVEKFSAAYPHARNVKWYFEKDHSEVYYLNAGIHSHIWYDLNGEVIKTRRDYTEKELAPFLKEKINNRYPKKKITGVTELSDGEQTCYVVILEDSKRWTYLKCNAEGDMIVTQKFKKAV